MENLSNKKIIFFDGECELCDRFVTYIFNKDSKKQFLYAPLQGICFKKLISQQPQQPQTQQTQTQQTQQPQQSQLTLNLNSIVFLDQGVQYKKSQAIAHILFDIYPTLKYFSFLPFGFYNLFYDIVAKKRYHWFGRKLWDKASLNIAKEYLLD